MLSLGLQSPTHHTSVGGDVDVARWLRVFEGAQINTTELSNQLGNEHKHVASIRELLKAQSATSRGHRVERGVVIDSLRAHLSTSDDTSTLTQHEYELIRQVRVEQQPSDRVWYDCDLVTTLLYNMAVEQNAIPRFEM